MNFKLIIAALLASIAVVTQANAAILMQHISNGAYSLDISYDSTTGGVDGNYTVTAISGTINKNAITNPVVSAGTKIELDGATPSFSGPAITFSSGGSNYNIFLNYVNDLTDPTMDAPVAVPEASTWAMMLLGGAGIGAFARIARRRRLVNPQRAVA